MFYCGIVDTYMEQRKVEKFCVLLNVFQSVSLITRLKSSTNTYKK